MLATNFIKTRGNGQNFGGLFLSFIQPKKSLRISPKIELNKTVAIIPTFKPGEAVLKLIKDLSRWNRNMAIFVVNDCSPAEYDAIFEKIKNFSDEIRVLRTPTNKMKSGAINFALKEIFEDEKYRDTKYVITMDDDVEIDELTIRRLLGELSSQSNLGAVCSRAALTNKNKNLLTRLQGLEYNGFNIIRLTDEGFFFGPLVMPGMLVAYKMRALEEAGGYLNENHLIEDYEMTVRIKEVGWHVRAALDAFARTEVPEKFSKLWRQRVRWMYGGLFVLTSGKKISLIIQDVIGHFIFITSFTLIVVALAMMGNGARTNSAARLIWVVAILSSIIWYIFQLYTMKFYEDKDWVDWLLRTSLIPEFLYSNLLTLILLGAYLFFVYNKLTKIFRELNGLILRIFNRLGYSGGWGTR